MWQGYRYVETDNHTGKIVAGVVIALLLLITFSAGVVMNKPMSLDQEEVTCKNFRDDNFLIYGYDGRCKLYVGSDGETHYSYVQYYTGGEEVVEKEIFMNWKTMEEGRY